jgi:hypothetical protein
MSQWHLLHNKLHVDLLGLLYQGFRGQSPRTIRLSRGTAMADTRT